MKLIPALLIVGILAVSGCGKNKVITKEVTQTQMYSAELVFKAQEGDMSAQCRLGYCYSEGTGVAKDHEAAVYWFRKSAEQWDALAQYNLGTAYLKGEGVTQDTGEAVKWYTKSAEQGEVLAQFILGFCYDKGLGVTQDHKEAVKWFRKSAEQGNADAKKSLKRIKEQELADTTYV